MCKSVNDMLYVEEIGKLSLVKSGPQGIDFAWIKIR